jgi:hypothetical protein
MCDAVATQPHTKLDAILPLAEMGHQLRRIARRSGFASVKQILG